MKAVVVLENFLSQPLAITVDSIIAIEKVTEDSTTLGINSRVYTERFCFELKTPYEELEDFLSR